MAAPPRGGSLVSCIVFVVVSAANSPVCECGRIRSERCLVWGPGLSPAAVLPVRYFFIQAVGSDGANLTLSPGKTRRGGSAGSAQTP